MNRAKVFYDPSTDSLSINLAGRPAVENEEIAENVIVGYDAENRVVLVEFIGLSEGITIRLDPETLDTIRSEAHEKGIGPTTLVRMLVMEHIKSSGRSAHNVITAVHDANVLASRTGSGS